MRQLRIINGKTCRMLEPGERLQRGDFFRHKTRSKTWEALLRPVPNTFINDCAGDYPEFSLYREIDPLIYEMEQAKRKARKS